MQQATTETTVTAEKRKYTHHDEAKRKRLVLLVKHSEGKSIRDIALENGVGVASLCGWCRDLMGPTVLKRVLRRSHAVRGRKVSEAAVRRNAVDPKGTVAEVAKFMENNAGSVPRIEGSLLRRNKAPTVTITVDPEGKISKYEVTGEVNVFLFTQVPKAI